MKNDKKQKFVMAALAGLVAVAGAMSAPAVAMAEDVHCYGVNKCKGTGDCGGKGHGCAGLNSCKGQGWVTMEKEACLKMEGGTLEAKA